ncbi:putative repressor of RNA polymerase III transcription MAF1 [Cocos nucifera]|uniref:Putative repressor of RNA polymerase III transcription MAF1 n=1 Tax=Cocos nucifera TaxID=13894 RepID=A0A8K0IYM6_COCNU|nr:putative repressor of RNA polymerase III transcription MAF1 [Cocos nucifera]
MLSLMRQVLVADTMNWRIPIFGVDELRKLLTDKEAYNALFNSLDQVKIQNNLRDELRKETLQLARKNLEQEPRIQELKNQSTIIRTTELAAAHEKLSELERQKEETLKLYSPASLVQKLHVAMNKVEEESEMLHKQLLEKEIDLQTFIQNINLFLDQLNLGESTIKGNLEAFSCKHTGTDRKLSLSLEHEILDYLGQSSDSDPSSPVEYLSSRSRCRRTLIYLVLTLSHMYPDYDFREEEWETFKQIYDTYLFEAAREWAIAHGGSSLLESMTKAIDELVKLNECEIYSYNPDFDGDPFLEKGAIWSFNFFFYNRKLKRVVSFRCCCISNLATDGFVADERFNEEEEEDLFIDMDM